MDYIVHAVVSYIAVDHVPCEMIYFISDIRVRGK